MYTNNFKELVANYVYGQFNILENEMTILYNPKTRQIQFDPFYNYDVHLKRGSCSELMNIAYSEILKKYPELHVTRVVGNDPNFFINPLSKHCFLFVSERDLMNGKSYSHEAEDIEQVIEQDPLIVDPCFKTVVPFSDSGYKVQKLMNQGFRVLYSNKCILSHDRGVPLGFDAQGNLVFLIANLDIPGFLEIGLQRAGSSILRYGFGDKDLLEILNKDQKIMRFVNLLKEKKISEYGEEFLKREDFFIE